MKPTIKYLIPIFILLVSLGTGCSGQETAPDPGVAILSELTGTVEIMILGQQEFEDVLAGLPDAFGRGPDDHALPDLVRAGEIELRQAFDLDEAHPAIALDLQTGVIAEMRDGDARLFGGLEDVRPLIDGDLDPVDGQADALRAAHRATA